MIEKSFLIAQIFGLCAMCISILSWQIKSPKVIILLNLPTCVLFGMQYIFLGASIGAITCFSTAAKDGALFFVKEKAGQFIIVFTLLITLLLLIINFTAWYDLLPITALIIYNAALYKWRENRSFMARTIIITKLCWIAYCSIVGAYAGAICAFLVLTSSLIGMARHEDWKTGNCYKTFAPSIVRALFILPSWRTYP
ncbi:MAG: YgjV family protein [Alphaproteobacteria bacterium]|nr:YgjV family protein [Alphaproteobacteria bacterium]